VLVDFTTNSTKNEHYQIILLEALTIDTEYGAKWEWNRTFLKEARKKWQPHLIKLGYMDFALQIQEI
jgi:hypothetical protein